VLKTFHCYTYQSYGVTVKLKRGKHVIETQQLEKEMFTPLFCNFWSAQRVQDNLLQCVAVCCSFRDGWCTGMGGTAFCSVFNFMKLPAEIYDYRFHRHKQPCGQISLLSRVDLCPSWRGSSSVAGFFAGFFCGVNLARFDYAKDSAK